MKIWLLNAIFLAVITRNNFWHILIAGSAALFIAIFIRIFFFQTFLIPSDSMYPILTEGDKIIVIKNKILGGYKKGDIVVFEHDDKYLVKRIVALGGDEILIKNGSLYINGMTNKMFEHNFDRSEYKMLKINTNMIYVIGDNVPKSEDSRAFGQVPLTNIRGRVFCIFAPFERMSFIKRIEKTNSYR